MNVNGRISMVTNYRDYSRIDPIAPSRGQLVSDYLLSDDRPLRYMERIAADGDRYNGFNPIAGNARELYYYSNYGNGVSAVPPGLHGLSNHLLNTPWPKVKNAVAKVKPIMTANRVDIDDLMDAMYDDTLATDADLPDTGIGVARERLLSPIFIKSPGYGSRNTTVVLVDRSDKVQFVERSYNITDFSYTTQAFSFRIR